jgi:hypothetical protein
MVLVFVGGQVDCDRGVFGGGVGQSHDEVQDVVVGVSLGWLGDWEDLAVLVNDLDDVLRIGVDETQNVSLDNEGLSD